MHKGIETTAAQAIEEYYNSYPIITDLHVNEAIKLEMLIKKVKNYISQFQNVKFEYEINTPDVRGFIDLLVFNENGTVDVYDFKYSNNVKNYMNSGQLHLYAALLQELGFKVGRLGFIFIPKTSIRQKKTEDLIQFRKRLIETLQAFEIQVEYLDYNEDKVAEFVWNCKSILSATEYPKQQTRLCDWCEYQKLCFEGDEIDMLPKNERRVIDGVSKKKLWFFGAPFTGKTTFGNTFPEPLMLNTDGNIKFVDAPYLSIKDQVTVEGRSTKRKYAWEVLKDVIGELEKKQNDFKTIIVDLLEDTYEHCRLYMYDKLGIEHESDNSFKAWDMVRTEFLSTLKKLMNLDYENIILISHEDTSKDLTKRSGDKITRIAPNIQEKTANKIAGMVDIVARIVSDDDERFMMFKTSEVVFGGGRLKAQTDKITLDYSELLKVYEEAKPAQPERAAAKPKKEKKEPKQEEVKEEAPITPEKVEAATEVEAPKRTRRARS